MRKKISANSTSIKLINSRQSGWGASLLAARN